MSSENVINFYSASSETRKKQFEGPLKLELQVQPSVVPKPYPLGLQSSPYPLRAQPNPNVMISTPSTTTISEPFETIKPQIDPALAAAIYQQHQINLNPNYSPLNDPNLLDPQTVNAILSQQYLSAQYPDNIYGLRQNTGTVSNQNRPPWANWFGANNNNNNNYQSDQPQQGPILTWLNNLAQNNPIANLLNNFQQQQQNDQNQNPFQNFISNLNPLNLFSNNNNRPLQPSMQADYISAMTSQNPYLSPLTSQNQMFSNNLDTSVFSSDQYLNRPNGNYNPGLSNSGLLNQGYNGQLQSANFNPGVGNPAPIFNAGVNGIINPAINNPYLNPISSVNRPNINPHFANPNVVQPYGQPFPHNPPAYPLYQNPYQSISPLTNPNFIPKKKTGNQTSKRKNNKKKVDVPDTDSDWFQDFLDKRKETSLELSTKRPKKKNEDDDDDFDDYFR